MTRDEAIDKALAVLYPPGSFISITPGSNPFKTEQEVRGRAKGHVDMLVALGLLKLDEPKSAEQEARDVLQVAIGPTEAGVALSHLRGAGFKIVKA